jgi:hypothetical protein
LGAAKYGVTNAPEPYRWAQQNRLSSTRRSEFMTKQPEIQPSKASSLEAIQFLLGSWQAESKPGEPSGGFSFVSQLQSRIILRTNYADYPATREKEAYRHEDLMVIYLNGNQELQADYYDSEGHNIRYFGQVTGDDQVAFISESTSTGPGFRLSYRLDERSILIGSFEIAPPDQPGTFMPYLSWSAHRM